MLIGLCALYSPIATTLLEMRVLLTAWGSFESGRVIWCTRQARRVLWRHRVIEGSLNVIPWLVYASLSMSE